MPVPIQIPVGEGELFGGIIDLLTMKAIVYRESTLGTEWDEMEIPHDLQGRAQAYRTKMLEAVSDEDDTLLEKYLEGKEITPRRDPAVLRSACLKASIIPVLCGSSFKNKGVQMLLDAVVDYLPSPMDLNDGKLVGHHVNMTDQIERRSPTRKRSPRWRFKIMTDPYVGKLTYFRVYSGTLKIGLVRVQLDQRQQGAAQPHPADAREHARGCG